MYKFLPIALLLSLVVSAQSNPNKPVTSKTSEINGEFLEPYSNKWKAFLVDSLGNKKLNFEWTDYAQILSFNGARCFHRVQELYSPKFNHQETWINMVELPSMRPRFFQVFKSSGTIITTTFKNDSVYVSSNLNEKKELVDSKYPINDVCYDWNLYGLLLVALPFEQGDSYSLPFFNQTTGREETLVVEIGPKEKIVNLKGLEFDVYRISTNQNLTFWIRKQPPYVMQTELYFPNGSKLLWETY